MASAFDSFLGGVFASDNKRQADRARTYQEKQIQLAEEDAGLKRDYRKVQSVIAQANDLGVTKHGGIAIDTDKLGALLQQGRDSGKFDPRVEQLVSDLGNLDLAVKNNPGFSFEGLRAGPDGTLTMVGSYDTGEKQGQPGALTTNRGSEDNDPMAFSPVSEVAGLVGDKFNQVLNSGPFAAVKNEIYAKQKMARGADSISANEAKISTAVGQLSNAVDDVLFRMNDEETRTQVKKTLANARTDSEKLQILQSVGQQLQIPVEQVITADVQKAVTDQQAQPEQTDPQATTPTSMVEMSEDEAATKAGAIIGKIQAGGERVSGGRMKRVENNETREKALTARKKSLEKSLTRLYAQRRNLEANQNTSPETLANLDRNIKGYESEQALIVRFQNPVEETPEFNSLKAKVDQATPEEIEAGRVPVTQEELAALQQRLQAKGIKSLQDMNKATREERENLRAVLSALAKDPQQRQDYNTALNNIIATGDASYDQKSLDEARLKRRQENRMQRAERRQTRAEARQVEELARLVGGDMGQSISGALKKFEEALNGTDDGVLNETMDWDEDRVKKQVFGATGAITQIWSKYRKADRSMADRKGGVGGIQKTKRDTLRRTLNSMYSMVVQAMNESGDYQWSFTTFDTAPGTFADSFFSRLQVVPDANGNPMEFNVIDPASGNPTGDTIAAEDVKKMFGNANIYNDFVNQINNAKSGG